MVVNDVPGEECRIALLEDDKLEDLYTERITHATGVGNIYKGRVVNVEPAIQAAFIDYGTGQNGFLHISDLHPRYFPGKEEKTERVGKKIPRRDRPPIQQALKRGDSILVQVIKEGIGTKGPTLTSYLSIPGRLMVMMPDMDRVGVSRKIEDEEKRREMRKVLDSLDLPDGIGFILRTAGFGRTKTELKRDLAYLTRLWKTMKKRIDSVQAPCPLYVESDLLIRTIRDILSPDIHSVIVDSESAYERAIEFMRVVAPRSAPNVIRYRRPLPIFHAFDIERQIDLIHAREVPLPSGGAIVIDQTEAVVAIDVNSGRSRSARDSETNAYKTNCEAVDEICRQLRLRDLGGLVIHDLIDMVKHDNRRKIEKRMADNLARDRARTSTTRISEFGIMEMTRQRMRPSMQKTHYQTCTNCNGRGGVRSPESMAAEALRYAAYLLQYDRVKEIEIVCSTKLASTLLSEKRRTLVRLEDAFGKTISVRVRETFPPDRVDYYAYDERKADIDITKLPAIERPTQEELEAEAEAHDADADQESADKPTSKRRRSRRGKKVASLEAALRSSERAGEFDDDDDDAEDQDADDKKDDESSDDKPKKKRRRRRRSRRKKSDEDDSSQDNQQSSQDEESDASKDSPDDNAEQSEDSSSEEKKSRRKRRRRRRSSSAKKGSSDEKSASEEKGKSDEKKNTDDDSSDSKSDSSKKTTRKKKTRKKTKRSTRSSEKKSEPEVVNEDDSSETSSDDHANTSKKKKKKTTRKRKSTKKSATDSSANAKSDTSETPAEPKKPKRRLYGSRRKVSTSEAKEARERQ